MTQQAAPFPPFLFTVVTYKQLTSTINGEILSLEDPQYTRYLSSTEELAEVIARRIRSNYRLSIFKIDTTAIRRYINPVENQAGLWRLSNKVHFIHKDAILGVTLLNLPTDHEHSHKLHKLYPARPSTSQTSNTEQLRVSIG